MSFESAYPTAVLDSALPAAEPLSSSVPAPKVAEILADPVDLESRWPSTVFASRTFVHDRRHCDSSGAPVTVKSVTEANALIDFDQTMSVVGDALRRDGRESYHEKRARLSEKFREQLHFIGEKEFAAGTEAIARHWLNRLDSSSAGELFVAISGEESSTLVYSAVDAALRALNPDAAEHVLPLHVSSLNQLGYRAWDRIARAGLVFVDDWVISGEQLTDAVMHAPGRVRNGPGGVEVNLICATDRHIQSGVGGVACKSHFVYPYTYDQPDMVSVTGAHCDTDYGFRSQVGQIFSSLNEVGSLSRKDPYEPHAYEKIPYPLLFRVLRDYRPSNAEGAKLMITKEEVALLESRRKRCSDAIGRVVDPTEL